MNIVLLGPPGAGKGTLAKRMERVVGFPHIATGDMLRSIMRQNDELGHELRQYVDLGKYVPDERTTEIVLPRLAQADARNGFLLDGYPRTEVQAESLDKALTEQGRKVDVALYITAPADVLVERLAGRIICPHCNSIYNVQSKRPQQDMICDLDGYSLERRGDEAPEVIRTRLDSYIRQTEPLVEHYREQGVLVEVDGSQTIERVETEVDAALGLQSVR